MFISKIVNIQKAVCNRNLLFVLSVWSIFLMQSNLSYADLRTSYSISGKIKNKASNSRLSIYDQIPQRYPALTPDLSAATLPNNTSVSLNASDNQVVINTDRAHSYVIRNASVDLLHDEDGDGHHHNFRVNFNADIVNNLVVSPANVYAKLYIGFSGRSLQLYATSDPFEIVTNGIANGVFIETILHEVYPTDVYDIQIELFELGGGAPVVIYGPADDLDLFKIPLEDDENDFVAGDAGCSLNENAEFDPTLLFLILFSVIYMFRRNKKYS